MKVFIIVVTLAFVAVQLTSAAPVPEDDKKEAAAPAAPAEVANASPRGAEVKVEEVGVTRGGPEATPFTSRDAIKKPDAVEKAQ